MKEWEKNAGSQESHGTRVGINKEMISLAVGGHWSRRGEEKNGAPSRNKQRRRQIFITIRRQAVISMFTKREWGRGGGGAVAAGVQYQAVFIWEAAST